MITTSEAKAAPRAAGRSLAGMRRGLAAWWGGRGWWGGLIAMGLAATGQQILLTQNDPNIASRYYIVAALLLIVALTHPDLSWVRRRGKPAARPFPVEPPPAIPVRRARAGSAAASTQARPTPLWTRLGRIPARWTARRARGGWRVTAGGLALTLVLAAAATAILRQDINDPRGGWLWAGALAALLLTFVGAAGWPRGGGLLPGPKSDFFAPGLPRLTPRWEAVLAGSLLALALVLRLTNLETMPGIFGDEGERGMNARAINEGQPANIFGYGWWGVPNFYFYIVSWMLRIFGDTMTGDRMLSVISGVLAVWFVYRTARLLWGPRAGLIAGALLAVSPLALQFSRVAGESTPTGTLWAGGFYFLFRALRHRKWSDWVLAGILWGLSLYFYAAGKLIGPILVLVGLYCLVRWRIDFFRRYFLGFVLLGCAFGLAFLPYALFSMQENPPWQSFTGRAQERSIFSPQNQAESFRQTGVPYDPTWASQPLVQNVLSHPLPWAQVVFQQLRITTEVLYRSGDPTPMFQTPDHKGSLLAPLWAALAILGLVYGLWKGGDGRFGLASIWFWGGLLGAALTLDTPSVQRIVGAWPAIMLFPAALLDRVAAGAWPISARLARRWSTVPLAALVLFFGGDSYREYFLSYGGTCTYCTPTVQARYAQALGQDYKAYQLGVGDYDIFFGYGSTRFAAKGIEGVDLAVPVDYLPISDNKGKGAAFIVYGSNAEYLPLLHLFYPAGKEELITGSDGSSVFTSYKVTREQLAATQTLLATYIPAGGQSIRRDEPNLGTLPARAPTTPWTAPTGLTYPATATWEGGLVAPSYGQYVFAVEDGAATLMVDGAVVLTTTGTTPGDRQVTLVLAKGMHDMRLSGPLDGPQSRINLRWGNTPTSLSPIPTNFLYNGPTGGLSGEVGRNLGQDLTLADVFAGQPTNARRSDPALGFRHAADVFRDPGFLVRWQGTIQIPVDGTYQFETHSNGASAVLIDGQVVVNNPPNGNINSAAGTSTLQAGPHRVDVRYTWQSGPARMEWFWTLPTGERTLVPPTVLRPLARSWLPGAVDAPAGDLPNLQPAPPAATIIPPVTILPVEVQQARGLTVAPDGQIYVADSGHHRILVLSHDGKVVRQWGTATDTAGPGQFHLLSDVAVTPDGMVATVDNDGDIQIFTPQGAVKLRLPAVTANGNGLDVTPDGRLWVADTSNARVAIFAPTGTLTGELRGGAADAPNHLNQPLDVAVAPDGALYVADLVSRIVRMDSTGQVTGTWLTEVGGGTGVSHLAVWHNQVVMTDPERNRLVILDPTTGTIRQVGTDGTNPGQFHMPTGIAVGPDGNLYVLDSGNGRIQVFSTLDPP